MSAYRDRRSFRERAAWTERSVTDAEGREIRLLTLAWQAASDTQSEGDGAAEAGPVRVVRREPAVAAGGRGRPAISLSLLLDGQPEPGVSDIAPYVRQGTLACELTICPPVDVLEKLRESGDDFRSVFPQTLTFSLIDVRGSRTLAESSVTLGQARAALSATVDAEEAVRLLAAARGRLSDLEARAALDYRRPSPEPGRRIELRCDLAEVHAFLDERTADDGVLYDVDLTNYLSLMLAEGLVEIESSDANLSMSDERLATELLDPFVRAIGLILEDLDEDERSPSLGARHRLGSAPHATFETRFTSTVAMQTEPIETLELRAPLEDVFAPAVGGLATETWLHVVSTAPGGGVEELRRRTTQRGSPRSYTSSSRLNLAKLGDRLTTLSSALRPSTQLAVGTHSVLAVQPIVNRLDADRLSHLLAAFTQDGEQAPQNLPVVRDPEADLWPDRSDESRSWYAPEFSLEADPTATLEDSPFVFSFQTEGHDVEGQPGIDAEIRFMLRPKMPTMVREAADADDSHTFEPVPLENLSARFMVPFRDGQGRTRREECRATVSENEDGGILVEARLRDDWARLAYGALAYEGFQAEDAALSIAFSFPAFVPVEKERKLELALGAKRLALPLVSSARERRSADSRSSVDVKQGRLRFPGGEVRFEDDASSHRARPTSGLTLPQPSHVSVVPATLAIRPELVASVTVADPDRFRDLVVGRRYHRATVPVLFPCGPHGSHYVERRDGETHAVACLEHFRLGQTEHRLLDEVALPAEFDRCRVYRSLQTPGLFVVVPKTYAIARYEPTEADRAYRPSLLLYSSIDVGDLEASRCMYSCTLQPDLPPFIRARLREHLRTQHHPEPELELFTELPGELAVEWALPTGVDGHLEAEIDTVRMWDGFEVSLTTDALGVPQLNAIIANSGISGTATLRLSDGSTVWTTLRLHLRTIVGPFSAGPLALAPADGGVTLENRIESPVGVSELLLVDEENAIARIVDVRQRLEPGDSLEVELVHDTSAAEVVPVFAVEPTAGSLEEIRSFIEDISVGLILLNRIDMEDSGVTKLTVEADLRGTSDKHTTDFTAASDPAAEINFLLPLTAYLADPVVELRILAERSSGPVVVDPIEWHVTRDGVMVHLTTELLGLPDEE